MSTPPSSSPSGNNPGLSKHDWSLHIKEKLRTGQDALSDRQVNMVTEFMNAHINRGEGINRGNIHAVMDNLTRSRDLYGISHGQIQHVKRSILPHLK